MPLGNPFPIKLKCKMTKRVTMQQIADAMGVAKVTVSRAFRGDPKCSPDLRRRILERAEALGYRPDPLQRAHMSQLRAGRPADASGTIIGFLDMHDRGYRIETDEVSGAFVKGARQRAESLGMRLEIFRPVAEGWSMERFRRVLRSRGIHGLIFGPMPLANMRIEINLEEIAAVAIAHTLESPLLHRVGHNHYQATWDAMRYLYERGCRRIGMSIRAEMMERVGQRWHAAYHEFCRTHRGVHALASSEFTDREQFLQWVERHRLDAILGLIPECVLWLREAGKRVPDDICYFDLDLHRTRLRDATLGIDQEYERIGATAVEEIVAQWGRQEYGVPVRPKNVLLPGVIREMMPSQVAEQLGESALLPTRTAQGKQTKAEGE